jgi:hypothetical protein
VRVPLKRKFDGPLITESLITDLLITDLLITAFRPLGFLNYQHVVNTHVEQRD